MFVEGLLTYQYVNDVAFLQISHVVLTLTASSPDAHSAVHQRYLLLLSCLVSLCLSICARTRVESVETLIYQLGDRDLRNAIEDVTKAELSRVFAAPINL